MSRVDTTTIRYGEIAGQVDDSLKGADRIRTGALGGLLRLRGAREKGAARELGRVRAKLGDTHPRVAALQERQQRDGELVRDLKLGERRAKSQPKRVPDDIWIVHGRVYSDGLEEQAGLFVALVDEEGNMVQESVSPTDPTGYFKLIYTPQHDDRPGPVGTPGHKLKVYLQAADQDGVPLYRDPRPLVPGPGTSEYREIVMAEEERPPGPRKKKSKKKAPKKKTKKKKASKKKRKKMKKKHG